MASLSCCCCCCWDLLFLSILASFLTAFNFDLHTQSVSLPSRPGSWSVSWHTTQQTVCCCFPRSQFCISTACASIEHTHHQSAFFAFSFFVTSVTFSFMGLLCWLKLTRAVRLFLPSWESKQNSFGYMAPNVHIVHNCFMCSMCSFRGHPLLQQLLQQNCCLFSFQLFLLQCWLVAGELPNYATVAWCWKVQMVSVDFW